MQKPRRVLLKLSGESLAAGSGHGIDDARLAAYAQEIAQEAARGCQIGIVIGGGNIFRGMSGAARGFDRTTGDQMGMLATVINALALGSALKAIGCKAIVYTAIRMEPVARLYSSHEAIEKLEDMWLSLPVVRAILSSQRILLLPYVRWKSRRTTYSKARVWMVSILPIPSETQQRHASTK